MEVISCREWNHRLAKFTDLTTRNIYAFRVTNPKYPKPPTRTVNGSDATPLQPGPAGHFPELLLALLFLFHRDLLANVVADAQVFRGLSLGDVESLGQHRELVVDRHLRIVRDCIDKYSQKNLGWQVKNWSIVKHYLLQASAISCQALIKRNNEPSGN